MKTIILQPYIKVWRSGFFDIFQLTNLKKKLLIISFTCLSPSMSLFWNTSVYFQN